MKIEHEFNGIKIYQMNYIHTLLHRHEMQDCNSVNTPMNPSIKLTATMNSNAKIDSSQYQQYIDELMFAVIATCSDIIFAISQLSSYNSNPCQRHLAAAKHVLKYLKEIINLDVVYKRQSTPK